MFAPMLHGPEGEELTRRMRGVRVSPLELENMYDFVKRSPFVAPVLRVLFDLVFPSTQEGLLSVFEITSATGTLGSNFEEKMRVMVVPLLLASVTDLITHAYTVLRFDDTSKQLHTVNQRQVDSMVYDRLGQRFWRITDPDPVVDTIPSYIRELMGSGAFGVSARDDMVVLVHPNQRTQPDHFGNLCTDLRVALGYSALNAHNMRAYMIGIKGAAGPTVIVRRLPASNLGHGMNHNGSATGAVAPFGQETSGVTPAINRAMEGESRALARSAEVGTTQANLASRVATEITAPSEAAKNEGSPVAPGDLFPTVIPQYVAPSTSRFVALPQGSDFAGIVASQPPQGGVVDIHDLVLRTVSSACGVPAAFVLPSAGAERIDAVAIDQLVATANATRQLAATTLQSILQLLFSTEILELLRRDPDPFKGELAETLIGNPLFTVKAKPVELTEGLQAVMASSAPPEPAASAPKAKSKK